MENEIQDAEHDIQHGVEQTRLSEVDKREVEVKSWPDPTALAQAAMLRMARAMQSDGHVHEAVETYCQIVERYPETESARAAANGLAELAQYCEDNGMPHTALEIYCQLEEMR